MPRGAQATLADVARAASVSTASVSRALTRPEAVSDLLRARVSAAATALGYAPNIAARALVRRRSGMIGLVAGDLDSAWTAPALAALDSRLAAAGWSLLLASCGKGDAPLAHAQTLFSRGVEALVFLGVGIPAELGGMPGLSGLPCVSVDRIDETGFAANAGFDIARAGTLIAEYLERLGHRRRVVVAETHSPIGTILEDALRGGSGSSGSTIERLALGEGSFADGVSNWFARSRAPTAAICASDAIALAVIHACARHGVDVPGQLSVVAFGDTPLARCVSPMLTSVRVPARSAGVAAVEYLLDRFSGRACRRVDLAVKLVVRGSTGPPRAVQASASTPPAVPRGT
jgi:LacI family transcriptional regulator